MRPTILSASIEVICEVGLGSWTVERVAARAGCAKGLVIYHFGSRRTLLEASAGELGVAHQAARQSAALTGTTGTAVLTALWEALQDEVRSGGLAGWLAVRSDPRLGSRSLALEQMVKTETVVADALGIEPDVLGPQGTLSAALDGIQLQMLAVPERPERGVYDRLWLALLAG